MKIDIIKVEKKPEINLSNMTMEEATAALAQLYNASYADIHNADADKSAERAFEMIKARFPNDYRKIDMKANNMALRVMV